MERSGLYIEVVIRWLLLMFDFDLKYYTIKAGIRGQYCETCI